MDNECDRAREQMADLLSRDLTDEQAGELRRHTDTCGACRDYLEGLQADDKLLAEFAGAMRASVERIERKVAEALEHGGPGEPLRRISTWRVVLKNPLVKLAAAAVVVAAVAVAVTILRNSKSESSQIVKRQDLPEKKNIVEPRQDPEPALQELLERELGQIRRMVAAVDIDGLVEMLDKGRPASRLAAANYLARIGDLRAIEALGRLGSRWNPEDGDNPFLRAISEIRARVDGQEDGTEPNEPARVEVFSPLKETSPAAGRQA
ncbi:MAG: zf-HC2 domain-containing protein, partial [Phycisphaerales bacterium]